FVDMPFNNEVPVDKELMAKVTYEMDSLRLARLTNEEKTIYPFNPNYITDYKDASLGMTNEEIDRLLNYRKQNKWINTVKQFQEFTLVSYSQLNEIAPYFKFQECIEKSVQNPNSTFNTKVPRKKVA